MDIAGVACVAIIGLSISALLGAVVVRAAVSLANRLISPNKEKQETFDRVEDWDWDAEPEEPRRRRGGRKTAVPEPGLGKSMMIASTANVLTAFIAFVVGTVAEETGVLDEEAMGAVVVGLFALLFGFGSFAMVLVPMLPTTFMRAQLVAFLYYFIGLLILVIVGGGVFAVWQLAGP